MERSVNDNLQTDGNAPKRTRTGRVRTEAPGHYRFAHPPVHWPRAAAPPPLFCHIALHCAAECRLGPTPTHCEGRLEGSEEPFFLKNFIKAHFNLRNPCESSSSVFLWCIYGKATWLKMLFGLILLWCSCQLRSMWFALQYYSTMRRVANIYKVVKGMCDARGSQPPKSRHPKREL